MLKKGEENAVWDDTYNGTDKVLEKDKKHWYEEVDFNRIGIPFCIRPKGSGHKVSFYTFSGLGDKAFEIKEAAPWKFRHTGDVNRNAHYIGMYILSQMYVKNKKPSLEEDVFKATEMYTKILAKKESLRATVTKLYDGCVQNLISYEKLCEMVHHISNQIKDKEIREWFENDFKMMTESDTQFAKIRHKLKMREARSKLKEVDGE